MIVGVASGWFLRCRYSAFMAAFAFTTAEFAFLVCAQLIVGLIYGGLAGLMSSFFMNQNAGALEKSAKMDGLQAWMNARAFAREMKVEIQHGFAARHGSHAALFNEREILDELPETTANRTQLANSPKLVEALLSYARLTSGLISGWRRLQVWRANSTISTSARFRYSGA
eukprot:COSAG01_NODE_944_length_12547_cov_7.354515_3_plen_170_part_00